MPPVRVLVVDDSRAMRALIRSCLERDPGVRVVGEAGDPYEAREAVRAMAPDVILLDVNMPKMDGLAFLERVMRLRPTPVIMVSSEVAEGSALSLAARQIGAVDCVRKPMIADAHDRPFPDLAARVRAAALVPAGSLVARPPVSAPRPAQRTSGPVLAIGASTGGVDALLRILSAFPENCPPTVVTQHMPEGFIGGFARRLNGHCAAEIREATAGAPLLPGRVYLAPGHAHLEVTGRVHLVCRLNEGPAVSGHRPSCDVMFASLARLGPAAVGVILTGMGRDGAAGLLKLRAAGGHTLGQDAATSLVYGMPGAAFDVGAVARQLPLAEIGGAALALCAAAGTKD
ncbi:two-component system chemotaxis response regulator CheB [Amaricoccus macauensis]|uniref:Protein-glutamate methylesterase/protein-glutamine glutaminase n=1 Tax=Amaricoccus macauensis TaxID=57001 RepID=A0A840SHR3_9RHOB|nr:chemotaxis response regulator protein-glutamate methylesterase [Amaricoccus macauensis]MBB5220225.1 two-component system chemotaxis response regulator CheB [Amaricoccus macauensis]